MIYTGKAEKISIYINSKRKSIDDVKAETGCTAVINGGLYDMADFDAVCHLKADGKVYAQDQYKYWGFAWDINELRLVTQYIDFANYICCVCMVRDGKAEKMFYSAVGGKRERTALGVFADGRVWLYASKDKLTPEQLQKIALDAGVLHAIMLDGGGSTQCIFPDGKVTSTRRVHNFICVWEKEQTKNEGPDEAVFRIALGAGHGMKTAGKRCSKALDPNETREWWLNDRVCDYVESYLKEYDGYALLRLDDSDDGAEDVALAQRVKAANAWDADFYLSIHHNAGVNGGAGGGIVAYAHPNSGKETVAWRDELYDALISNGGLRGNRSTPKATSNLYVLRETRMPAVLLELGFMDSKTDVPVILTDTYAQRCARAIVNVIVKRGGLTKKVVEPAALYRVQLGAFANKANAEALAFDLKSKGYQAYIVKA